MSIHSLKLLTFDLDNTLWASDPVILHAEQKLYHWLQLDCRRVTDHFTMEGLREVRKEVLLHRPELRHQVSRLRQESLKSAMLQVGYNETQASRYAAIGFKLFHDARQEVKFFDHALHVLHYLSQLYPMGALTNGNADIHKLGLDPFFQFVFSAEQVGAGKPAADLFQAAIRTAGVQPHEVLHIGDSPTEDIMGAHQAGMRTLWVNIQEKSWSESLHPDGTITCLSQLPDEIMRIDKHFAKPKE